MKTGTNWHKVWLCASLCLLPMLLVAQDAGSQAGQMWKDAQSAFGAGDYLRAIGKLEGIVNSTASTSHWLNNTVVEAAPPTQLWLEPVFFMLGASHFNARDWPAAISILDKYRHLFPHSPRIEQMTFSLAQAQMQGGRLDDAIANFTSLLQKADYHVKAFLLIVEAYKKENKPDQAVALIEKEKTQPHLNPYFLQKINMALFSLYLESGKEDKAVPLLREMDADIAHVADSTAFNRMAIHLGDSLLARNNIAGALDCYRRVRDNLRIIELQKQQIQNLQRQRTLNLARIQTDPMNSSQLQVDNKEIDSEIARNQEVLKKYEALPPVLPPLFLRIARAYSSEGQIWEAAVVYREIMSRYPQSAESEIAHYGSIVLFEQLKQNDRAQGLCQAYLTQYPKGKFADSVGFLRGVLAYDAEDFDKALGYFNDCLKTQPNNPRREQIELILGDIELREQKFDDALGHYQKYLKDFPQGQFVEPATYHTALAMLFGGKGDDSEKALRDYLQKYPKGPYVADAEYRLAVIKFAGKHYDEVLADCKAWRQKHGKLGPLAEVLTLMGDCYTSEDRNDEAVKAYIDSYKEAHVVEVLNYAIFAAAKLLQKQAKWTEIRSMFQEFVKNSSDHPTAVSALFWIGRADIKLGKLEEGKHFLANTAKQYLDDPSREAVDEIITQLAQLYARKSLGVAMPAVTPARTEQADLTAATAAAPNPAVELEQVLIIPGLDSKPTARARIYFAKYELARIQKKPEIQKQILLQIAKDFKPEDLSPALLGQVGDYLLQVDQPAQAMTFYNHLMDDYDKSPLVDYAYNGLAQIASAQKDYLKAERYYGKALDKGLAATKLKEITLGEAQTLMALKRPAEAKPLFEQIAGTRAWRGEATAVSVYSLGKIQMGLGKFAEANAFYQRVFVAYQKYPAIQAKAYLGSGEAFEKLGKTSEAINTYSELLRNPNLNSYPEIADARQRLERLNAK